MYMFNQPRWELGLLQVVQGDLKVYTFEPEYGQEPEVFWREYVLPRREVLVHAIINKKMPQPYQYNEDWECKHCPHAFTCQFGNDLPTVNERDLGIPPYRRDYMDRADSGVNPLIPKEMPTG